MHLMKWFRKNNQKLMAIVVVVLMVGFIGGTALMRSCESIGQSRNRVTALFGQNEKIRLSDIDEAQVELLILRDIRMDSLLRSLPIPMLQTYSLQGVAMGEILFGEKTGSSMTIGMLKQARQNLGLDITDKQIYDLLKSTEQPYIYWLLLKKEAQLGGIKVSKQQGEQGLRQVIPMLFEGASYEQVVNAIVNAPMNAERMPVSREQILTAFSNLMAVLEYGRFVCSTEDVTEQQIMHSAQSDFQTLDVNYVRFDSDVFIKEAPEPRTEDVNRQFEKHKDNYAGELSNENPYGFGYKIPDCVQLQYIAVRIEDVEKIVVKPTQEEMEQFYNKYKPLLIEKVRSDPNDPNSPEKTRTKPFAEVADMIEQDLFREKVETKSNQIIQRAMSLTETPEAGSKAMTAEDFSKIANNYQTASQQLRKEFNLEAIWGQTGLLSASEMRQDEILGRLILRGPQFDRLRNPAVELLYRIVFAVEQLGTSEIDTLNFPKPVMYKTIGPLNDTNNKIKAIFRIVKTQKAGPPESINQTINKETIVTEPAAREIKIYSVKSNVAKDLKKLAILDLVRKKAEDFKQQVETTGDWQSKVDELNKLYPKGPDKKADDPNNFGIVNLVGQGQILESKIYTLKEFSRGDPAIESELLNVPKQKLFLEQLYALATSEPNVPKTPLVWGFATDMSFYCIKKISVRPVYQNEYLSQKVRLMFIEDILKSQGLALIYYNPDNILKRNRFRWQTTGKTSGPNDVNQLSK